MWAWEWEGQVLQNQVRLRSTTIKPVPEKALRSFSDASLNTFNL